MPMTTDPRLHKSLRSYLEQEDGELARAANRTWDIAKDVHDRQTAKDGNIQGRKHVKAVEENIWRLLTESRDLNGTLQIHNLEPADLYLLSCAACCHDFDKGLQNVVLPENFNHGEGSGDFVCKNWSALGIVSDHATVSIDWIVAIHDSKEDFDKKLETIPEYHTVDGRRPGDLHRIAALLKACDTLHFDASRISKLAVPNDTLAGDALRKQLQRLAVGSWKISGDTIRIISTIDSEAASDAIQSFESYFKTTEWPPIGRALKPYQFPHKIEFVRQDARISPPRLKTKDPGHGEGMAGMSDFRVTLTAVSARPRSDKPLKLVAVPSQKLAEHLCQTGLLSVIENPYIKPQWTSLRTLPGARNCLFVGPADRGKTRAAYQWIVDLTLPDRYGWVVLRPEKGFIPADVNKIEVVYTTYYGTDECRASKAILFADDLPMFLAPEDSGTDASAAVKRLLDWFAKMESFRRDRRFAGTIRSELMHDKPGWPDSLVGLGKVEIFRVEPLGEDQRRELWKGLSKGKVRGEKGPEKIRLEISEDFLDAVVPRQADPEAIAYYAKAMAEKGKNLNSAEDSDSFEADVTKIWLAETWPVIHDSYGLTACVFLTLSRFLEAGTRPDSGFTNSLSPDWEFHAVFGPPMLAENGGRPEEYVPAVERMLKDGHAEGEAGEWVRPRFDFLLQASSLGNIEVGLPNSQSFAKQAPNLSPNSQGELSYHLSSAGRAWMDKSVTVHWLFGQAQGLDYTAEKDSTNRSHFYEQEIATYDELIGRFGDDETPEVRKWVAMALYNKSVTLWKLNRTEEELAACDELVGRFGDDETPVVREQVAMALYNKSVTLWKLNRTEEELAACDELVGRFGNDETPVVREQVAMALYNKSVTLGQLNRTEERFAAYDELLGRFGDDETPVVREQVASTLYNKSVTLRKLNRTEEELAACDELVGRFGDDETPVVREQVASTLYNKSVTLWKLNRTEEELAACDELVGRFGNDETPVVREQVAMALYNKSVTLGQLNRTEERFAAYDELLGRFGDDETPVVREQVASTLYNKSVTLGQLNRNEDALTTYDELLGRFGDDETPVVREQVANALYNKSVTLRKLNRPEDALGAYDEMLGRFGDDETPEVREQVAKALCNKGITLGLLNRTEEELAAYDELVGRFGNDETPVVREQVANALYNKSVTLRKLNRNEDALTTYDELLGRFGDDETPEVRERVAKALLAKGVTLGQLNRNEDALTTYDELLGRFGGDETPEIRISVAMALSAKGVMLEQLNRKEDALGAYDELVERFGDDETPGIRNQVAAIHYEKAGTLLHLWHRTEEQILLERAISAGRQAVAMGAGHYNLACGLALAGETDEAFELLERALNDEEISWSDVSQDADWEGLRDHPRYRKLKEECSNSTDASV